MMKGINKKIQNSNGIEGWDISNYLENSLIDIPFGKIFDEKTMYDLTVIRTVVQQIQGTIRNKLI